MILKDEVISGISKSHAYLKETLAELLVGLVTRTEEEIPGSYRQAVRVQNSRGQTCGR